MNKVHYDISYKRKPGVDVWYVRGGKWMGTVVRMDGSREMVCTCPQFEQRHYCSHIHAVLQSGDPFKSYPFGKGI